MKGRTIALILTGGALLIVLALCGLTAYGAYSYTRDPANNVRFMRFDTTSAEIVETRTFAVEDSAWLEMNTRFSTIEVQAYDGAEIVVEMTKTAWGADQAEAEARAKEIKIDLTQDGNRVKVEYLPENQGDMDVVIVGSVRNDSVDFKVKVPVKTSVQLVNHNGSINLTGIQGKADVSSSFGGIDVSDCVGPLTASSENGDLVIKNIAAGESDILISTSFGRITAEKLNGELIALTDENGEIDLTGAVASGKLSAQSSFGQIKMQSVTAGELYVESENGAIHLKDGQISGNLQAITSFGDLDLRQVAAAGYKLENNNGAVSVDEASGLLKISTGFGAIRITHAQDAVLQISSENGAVEFSGSLDESSDHSVSSSFGDITLSLPSDSSFDFDLETSFGTVESDLPVTMSGTLSDTRWAGSLNDGGALLTVKNENGDIVLRSLQ